MHDDLPHYLRFARTLVFVGSVTAVGCSSTVAGQDVPAADWSNDFGIAADAPPPGISVAPDVPGDRPVLVDAGISVSPDSPPPGIAVAPDAGPDAPVAPDASTEPDVFVGADVAPDGDAGTSVSLDGPFPGVVVAPDAPDA